MRWLRNRLRGDAGLTTAEYAMVTLAAVALAAALMKVVSSQAVHNMIMGIIRQALS